MIFYIATLILGFIIGSIVGTLLLFNLMTEQISKNIGENIEDDIPEVVDQLSRCHKFMLSLPVRDQRLQQLLMSNQRVLSKAEDNINKSIEDI